MADTLGCLLGIFMLRHAAYIVCAVVATILWIVGGFEAVPWISALCASVTVGCAVMFAKAPPTGATTFAAIAAMLLIDALLWAGVVQFGFMPAFVAWGIAHLAGVVTSNVLLAGAAGSVMLSEHPDQLSGWILSRGTVFGIASVVGCIATAGI